MPRGINVSKATSVSTHAFRNRRSAEWNGKVLPASCHPADSGRGPQVAVGGDAGSVGVQLVGTTESGFARGVLIRLVIIGLLLGLPSAWAQEASVVPTEEISRVLTPTRITALVDRAASQGWGSVAPALRAAALQAYETNSGYVPAWYYLYRWADLLATPYNTALNNWIKAVEKAGVAHPNMPARYDYHPGSLSAQLARALQLSLLGNAALVGK